MSENYTYSNEHAEIKNKLYRIAGKAHNINEYAALLKVEKIGFEDIQLTNGRQLLVFTGSSGYDIAGCAIKYKNKKAIIEDMYN